MKQIAYLLVLLCVVHISSFVPSYCNQRYIGSSTKLFGTIKFVGNAQVSYETPPIVISSQDDEDKSLSKFFTTSASDEVLCGGKTNTIIEDDNDNGDGVLWESRQGDIGWFGMTLSPIFINRITKNTDNVVVLLEDGRTEVLESGRLGLGNTLASAMKLSNFDGRNVVTYKSNDDQGYTLDGALQLTLTIELPPFLPLPPGFNSIGSRIVQSTCKGRLKQHLVEISGAYLKWTLHSDTASASAPTEKSEPQPTTSGSEDETTNSEAAASTMSTETTSSDISKETSSDKDEDRSNSDNSIYVTTTASDDNTTEAQAMSAEVTTSAEEVSIEGNNELTETDDINNVGGEKMRKRDRLKRKLKQLIK